MNDFRWCTKWIVVSLMFVALGWCMIPVMLLAPQECRPVVYWACLGFLALALLSEIPILIWLK